MAQKGPTQVAGNKITVTLILQASDTICRAVTSSCMTDTTPGKGMQAWTFLRYLPVTWD